MQLDDHRSERQPLVFLDVGGKPFKISRTTLARYPDSLLSKMAEEFPNLVENRDELFIDRSPKAFPWIQEIYRDGNYKVDVPNLPRELLQKELDFYQLPSLTELLVGEEREIFKAGLLHRDAYAEQLMEMILLEIEESGLRDFYPWTILIYHKIVDGKMDPKQCIYISPPLPIPGADYINKRGHQAFDGALQMEGDLCPRQAFGERSKLSPYNQNTAFLIWKKGYAFIELLETQAEKYGMELEEAKAATFCLSNGKMVYGHFILDYKA